MWSRIIIYSSREFQWDVRKNKITAIFKDYITEHKITETRYLSLLDVLLGSQLHHLLWSSLLDVPLSNERSYKWGFWNRGENSFNCPPTRFTLVQANHPIKLSLVILRTYFSCYERELLAFDLIMNSRSAPISTYLSWSAFEIVWNYSTSSEPSMTLLNFATNTPVKCARLLRINNRQQMESCKDRF